MNIARIGKVWFDGLARSRDAARARSESRHLESPPAQRRSSTPEPRMTRTTKLKLLALTPLAMTASLTLSSCEDGFEPFFDGQTLNGLTLVGIGPSDVRIEDGTLKCDGQPNGYIYKNVVYRNFILKLQFRFEHPATLAPGEDASFLGNSGYFVYLRPPHQVWPEALEIQGSYQQTGDIFGLPFLTSGNDNPDVTALDAARKPVGEWNDLRITSQSGALEVELNGHVVNRSTPGTLAEGLIALESEGSEIHWRNILVKPLP